MKVAYGDQVKIGDYLTAQRKGGVAKPRRKTVRQGLTGSVARLPATPR